MLAPFLAAAALHAQTVAPPVLSSSMDSETRRSSRVAPSSAISPVQATELAARLQENVPGTAIYSVRATGSMRPLFDGNCMLLTEPAAFADLAIGDIIIFRHSRTGERIVHRILERRRGGYWTKGDHNLRMDDELVTPENYEARIYGIIYTTRSKKNQAPDAIKNSEILTAAIR